MTTLQAYEIASLPAFRSLQRHNIHRWSRASHRHPMQQVAWCHSSWDFAWNRCCGAGSELPLQVPFEAFKSFKVPFESLLLQGRRGVETFEERLKGTLRELRNLWRSFKQLKLQSVFNFVPSMLFATSALMSPRLNLPTALRPLDKSLYVWLGERAASLLKLPRKLPNFFNLIPSNAFLKFPPYSPPLCLNHFLPLSLRFDVLVPSIVSPFWSLWASLGNIEVRPSHTFFKNLHPYNPSPKKIFSSSQKKKLCVTFLSRCCLLVYLR